MCKFQYLSEPDKTCPYPDLFEAINNDKIKKKLRSGLPDMNYWSLPLDDDGTCVFHSADLNFKRAQKSVARFRELVSILNYIIGEDLLATWKVMDFNGFSFCDERVRYSEEYETDVLDLSDLTFKEYVMFNETVWRSRVLLDHCEFKQTAYFENAIFKEMAEFKDTKFSRAHFTGSRFEQGLTINYGTINSINLDKTTITGGQMMETDIKTGFHAKDLEIKGFLFDNVTILTDEAKVNHEITFSASRFQEVTFRQNKFNATTDFSECTFDQVEFVDSFFANDFVLNLDHISVANSLIFKSSNKEKKLFSHQVSFQVLSENIQGKLIFENANVHYITPSKLLNELARVGTDKVVIGDGCERYRLKKEYTLECNPENAVIIEELANSFVHFFSWDHKGGIKLQMEVEYYDDYILVRYFSDQNLEEKVFAETLAQKVPAFLTLLKNPLNFIRNDPKIKEHGAADEIKTLDLLRQVLATNIGLLARIQNGKDWTKNDTNSVFEGLPADSMSTGSALDQLALHDHFLHQGPIIQFGNIKVEGDNNQIAIGEEIRQILSSGDTPDDLATTSRD